MSPAFANIMGFASETSARIGFEDGLAAWYTNPADYATFIQQLTADEQVKNVITELICPVTGERRWVRQNAWLVYNEMGLPTAYEATLEDISTQKKNEAQLEHFMRFRQVLTEFIEETLGNNVDESFYQKLLETTVEMVPGAQAGCIQVKNEIGRYNYVAAVGFDLQALKQISFSTEETLLGVDDTTPKVIHSFDYVKDVTIDLRREDILQRFGRMDEIKASLSTAIVVNDDIVAVMYLNNFESKNAFNTESSAVTKTFARYTGALLKQLTLETAFTTQQTKLRRWAEFHEAHLAFMTNALNQGLDESFFQHLLHHVHELIPGIEGGSILLKNADGDYGYVATLGFDLEALRPVTFKKHELWIDPEDDLSTTKELSEHNREIIDEARLEILKTAGRLDEIKQFILLPVHVDGDLAAVLSFNSFSHYDAFDKESKAMANSFAAQVGVLLKRLTLEQELEHKNEQLLHLASYDSLTGLPNRLLFKEKLEASIARASKFKKQIGLLFLDLDGFKLINDSLGHSAGDSLLIEVAERLKNAVHEGGTVSRLGGDEFTLVLNDITCAEDASTVAQRVITCLAEPFSFGERKVHVGASIGITVFPEDGTTAENLIKNADTAMYAAKNQGKNRYHYFKAQMNTLIQERLELEYDMRQGLARDEFSLHYQPRIDLSSGHIVSVEALARWNHPKRGFVSPGVFIPLAEKSDLILRLGQQVLLQACQQAKIWQASGHDIGVAVNLSVKQLQRASITQEIRAVLSQTGLRPDLLELEITESAAMTNVEENIAKLDELRQLGIAIAIDDFGTGYSSLNYLKRLPVTSLKIDQSFVRDIGASNHQDTDAAIVRAVIALGKSLNYTLVAEGIETSEQLEFLKTLKCDEGQGYLFCKPLSPEALEAKLDGSYVKATN